jgi:hypothetical protein
MNLKKRKGAMGFFLPIQYGASLAPKGIFARGMIGTERHLLFWGIHLQVLYRL